MADIKVGIVGLGWAASGHVPAFSENPHCTIDALCTYADRSGARVIATGIDTPRLLAAARSRRGTGARSVGIHGAQGYHLGKPLPQARPPIAYRERFGSDADAGRTWSVPR